MIIETAVIFLGFILGALFTKWVQIQGERIGRTNRDAYKEGNIQRVDIGGLGFVLGLMTLTLLLWLYTTYHGNAFTRTLSILMFIETMCVSIAGLSGLAGDILKFDWITNTLIPMFSALPLIVWTSMDPSRAYINFPIIGSVYFGWLYYLALLIGATGTANATNMVAGVNGIESGLTMIILSSIGIMDIISGNVLGAAVSFSVAAVVLGFFYLNKYPAKVFPGDVGTMSFGASILAAVIISKLEFWGVLLYGIYFVNLAIFLRKMKYEKKEKFGRIRKDGRLTSKYGSSLTKWLMKKFHPTEPQLVSWILLAQMCVSAIVIAMYWILRPI